MIDILVTRPMMDSVLKQAAALGRVHRLWEARDPEALLREVAPKTSAILAAPGEPRLDAAFLARFPALEMISSFGVGYDHVDADYAGAHGILVGHTPDVLNEEVADLAIGLMIAVVRSIPQADRYVREGRWPTAPYPLSDSLRGRRLGILGLGRIGKAIARRAEGFGLPIAYHGRSRQPECPYLYCDTPVALAKASDILMVIAPGGERTRHIVDRAVLEALGSEGYLINVARGSLVDEAALIAALDSGVIRGAGLDVFADEPRAPEALMRMERVVALPHVGSASVATREAMAQRVIDNLAGWLAGTGPVSPVPETPYPECLVRRARLPSTQDCG